MTPDALELLGFGARGWGLMLLKGAGVTVLLAGTAFVIGASLGALIAWAKISGGRATRALAETYTTVVRGIPDLLVIYLFYFGGSILLTKIANGLGRGGFLDVPGFAAGAVAVGIVSAAQHAEVFRGAFRAVSRGEIEAALAVGMPRALMFRRIIAPLVIRHALPGMGNVWQLSLKESALVSVTGVVELLRQSQMASGSTRQPFTFFLAAAVLYLLITTVSGVVFSRAEALANRGQGRK